MPSLLDLTNRALAELGKPNVTTIDPTDPSSSPAAIYVSNKILELYQEVLLDYTWNFAVVYVANYSPETTNFSPDYVYSYQLPGNYGRFFKWASTGAQWPLYAIEDGLLLANTLPVQYYYIANDIPFEVWPPLVARLLVLYAAWNSSNTLTNNQKLTDDIEKRYEKIRARAVTENDMERSVQSTPYNDFDRITFV
jgi:hypothetical protein